MGSARNHYCSNCLMTRRFHDADDHFVCERCRKVLLKPDRTLGSAS